MASNQMRISGVNSGFDTEAMIQQMMSVYQTKIDNQNKKLQKLQWQQEQYRDITSKLSTFKNKYFDILKRDTYLMSPSSFNKFSTTITTKSGKDSNLKVTTDSKSMAGSHKIKVNSVAKAAKATGNQVASANFGLDAKRAIEAKDVDNGSEMKFSLDVKVGNVAKTVEFSVTDTRVQGQSKDDRNAALDDMTDNLAASLNAALKDAFGTIDGSTPFISANANADGEINFTTAGNAMATVTERSGCFGMAKLAQRVAVSPSAAVEGKSSVLVSVPNFYDKDDPKVSYKNSLVNKNITFDTHTSGYYDGRDEDTTEGAKIKDEFMELKKAAFLKQYSYEGEVTEEVMNSVNFKYTSLDAADDYNAASMVTALNNAYSLEQGITFSIDGSSMVAKYIQDGSYAEFSMTSTCDATLGLVKGSATSYIDENTKLSELGLAAPTSSTSKDYTLPDGFKLDISQAILNAETDAGGKYNFKLDVKVGENSKTISFSGSDEDSIAQSLNSALAAEFADSGLKVEKSGSEYAFKISGGDSLSITENVGKFGFGGMSESVTFDPLGSDDPDETMPFFMFNVTGADGNVHSGSMRFAGYATEADYASQDGADYMNLKRAAYRKANGLDEDAAVTADQLAGFEYSAKQAASDKNLNRVLTYFNNEFDQYGIGFEYADGKLSAKDLATGDALKMSVASDKGDYGVPKGSASYTFPTSDTPSDGTPVQNYTLNINGKEISVDKNATISDLMNAVNKSDAGVTMSYSKLSGAFTLEASDKGAGGKVNVADTEFARALKLTEGTRKDYAGGENASFTFDGVEIAHNDNVYEFDGVTYDFSDVDPENSEEISVIIDKDYTDIKKTIMDFVNDYNQMIDDVNVYTQTQRPKDKNKDYYEPLTDEEKEDMDDKEIEKWEEAAKKGLLYHDSTVMSVMSRIRSAMSTVITLEDGSKFALSSMGVSTASLLDADGGEGMKYGKLKVNEDTLDKALSENPDKVIALFTDLDNGVMSKVNKAIESAVKDTGKVKGTLVRKAGLATGTSAKDNSIYKEMERINKRIEQLQDRYDSKEEYWWKVFTNLEKMQAQFDSQQNYITQFTANGGSLSSY